MNHRAYRCSTCNENWPFADRFKTCPGCGGDAWPCSDPPTQTHAQAQAIANQRPYSNQITPLDAEPPATGTAAAHAHRIERYLALGFNDVDAELLACATTVAHTTTKTGRRLTWHSPLHHLRVAALLAAGATHAQAVAVFA